MNNKSVLAYRISRTASDRDSPLKFSRETKVPFCINKVLLLLCVVASFASEVAGAADDLNPERSVQDGVPEGKLTTGALEDSGNYPGTRHDYSVYVPAQYNADEPAALMVFMDGSGYAKKDGTFRVPVVFDNLIHQKKMPVTIAVFVNPGTILATIPGAQDRSNRSYEYDSLGDRYANFLIDEFLPVALKGLNVSTDPANRAVCGISSSGICAFTVAWEKPDQFGKVLSHIGSFTNIRGGWAYPGLVRKSQENPKAIKVYLQEGRDDVNNLHGNWPLSNQDLAAALQFAGYKYKLVMTDGGHSGKWGGEVLPDALRWLWDDNAESTRLPTSASFKVEVDRTNIVFVGGKKTKNSDDILQLLTAEKTAHPNNDELELIVDPDSTHDVRVTIIDIATQAGFRRVKNIIRESKPEWQPHADAVASDSVPKGSVEQMEPFESTVFPGTIRDWSIYVPAQYKKEEPAALMVFQDGEGMKNVNGRWRVPTVFDNLIARGDIPPTIAVFINPGHNKSKPRQNGKHSNRSLEYDSLGDRYVRFLLEEIIPEVRKRYAISDDPEMHAIGGSSSGAICAFTAAWERTAFFRKVYSSVGSFTNLRGGNVYPSLIRKTEPKPIRVYLADTSGDIDNSAGSWPWSNQQMASALQYMGYDTRFDWAEGYAHNADFGGSKFPDAMQWLWRKEAYTPTYNTSGDLGGDLTLLNLLIPGESWELVADNLGFADALCADKDGNLYFCDMKAPAIIRINAADGSRTEIVKESVSGLEFASDGSLLYACQGSKDRVISINPSNGEVKTVAEGVKPNDLAVTGDGFILFTDTGKSQVSRINPQTGEVTPVDTGITKPNGIALSSDGGTLAVSDYGGTHTWTFRVNPDGVLDAKMPSMPMRLPIDPIGEFQSREPPPYIQVAKGDGMAVDTVGRYYVTSELGVQIFDPTGRPCGVLPKPDPEQPLTTCILAGTEHSTLYIAHGTKIYCRKVTVDRPGK